LSGVIRKGDALLPTRAAIALFGSLRAMRNLLPRPIRDVQFLGYGSTDEIPEARWVDRLVCEENILQAWRQLLTKYLFFMPRPLHSKCPFLLDCFFQVHVSRVRAN
jgi:hypothetical protein